jgi:hypothetical protein
LAVSIESPNGGSASLSGGALGVSLASNPLEVSQSCNEVSIGADYSVEDSTELDQCDHIEDVEVSSSPQKQEFTGAASSEPVVVTSVSSSSRGPPEAAQAVAASAVATKAKQAVDDEEDDAYANESFEDNASVPESIEENSDPWDSDP